MARYYSEGDLFARTIYIEGKEGNFQSRIDKHKPVYEATDEELTKMIEYLRNKGMIINVVKV